MTIFELTLLYMNTEGLQLNINHINFSKLVIIWLKFLCRTQKYSSSSSDATSHVHVSTILVYLFVAFLAKFVSCFFSKVCWLLLARYINDMRNMFCNYKVIFVFINFVVPSKYKEIHNPYIIWLTNIQRK